MGLGTGLSQQNDMFPRRAAVHAALATLDHGAVAAHAFLSVPSLQFLGLSLHSSNEAEYWFAERASTSNSEDEKAACEDSDSNVDNKVSTHSSANPDNSLESKGISWKECGLRMRQLSDLEAAKYRASQGLYPLASPCTVCGTAECITFG